MRRFGYMILGAFAGGVLGAALALLLAPSSGPQLRTDLNNRLQGIIDDVKSAAEEKRLVLEKQISDLRSSR